ncbi:MAG: hypothetical protein ACI4JC_03845 [Faecalibacterium sp.]
MAGAIELAKAYVQIVPSAEGIQGALQDALGGLPQEGEQQGHKTGQGFAAKFASAASKILAAAGLGKALASTLNAGGALQQSLGGVETLFKSSADMVKAYASDAWKSAGTSANEYMQSVSGFAAALRASFGGSEEAVSAAAAESANQAMIDMADNANKMGTAMESIQMAYQGFAKQNYTLLDNLKLGYGGTKTEMERLLADAQKLTGVKYDIGNLADVYDAIHVIQQELGITGTTALEASTTLSGSFSAMKAAAQDLLGNLALGEELKPSLDALSESVHTWLADNLLPMAGNILRGIPVVIAEMTPEFLAQGTGLIRSLADGMTQGVPQLLEQALPALVSFTAELRANFGELVSAGIDLILSLANGIVAGLPQLFAHIPDIVINIAGLINDNAPKLLAGGVELVVALIRGILNSIPLLVQNAGKITEAVLSVISAVNWIHLGANLLKGIADGVRSMVSGLTDAFKTGFSGALNWLKSLPGQALQWGKDLIDSFINGLTGKGGAATLTTAGMELVRTAASDAFSDLWGEDMDMIADKTEANALRMENSLKAVQKALADSVTRTTSGENGSSRAAESISDAFEEAAEEAEILLTTSEAVKAAMTALGDSFSYTADEAQLQADRLAVLRAAADAAQDDVQRLSYLFTQSARETGAASKQTQYLSAQLDKARDTLQSAQQALQDYEKQLDKGAAAQEAFTQSAKGALSALDGFGGALSELGELLGSKGLASLGKLLGDMTGGVNTVLNFAASIQTLAAALQTLGRTEVLAPLVQSFTTGVAEIGTQAGTLAQILTSTFASLEEPLAAAAKAISSALSGGLLSAFPAIFAGFASLIGTIGAAVESMLAAVAAALSSTVFGIPAGLVAAAAAVALGVAIAAIVSRLGGTFKPSTSPSAGTGGSVSGVIGSSTSLWDYEKAQPLPQRQPRPNIEVNQYIYSKAQTAADLMREAQYAQERAVLQGV